MIDQRSLSALVLAGGQSRRLQALGAVDKGLLQLASQPLISHAVAKLKPYASTVLISANQHTALYARYGEVVNDDPSFSRWQGPLVGLLTALEHIQTPWLVCLPVDSPFLPQQVITRLLNAQASNVEAQAFFATAERAHPLCLLVHQELRASLRSFLESGERRVQRWLEEVGAQSVSFGVEAEPLFANINTVEQWLEAQRLSDE